MQFQDIRTGELVKKRFEWAVIIELRIGRNPKASFNCERKSQFNRILQASLQPDGQNPPHHPRRTRESSGRDELSPPQPWKDAEIRLG